jgi:hypothetical protein
MEYLGRHRGAAMPVSMMAVLALMVFGAMGILLATVVTVEHAVHAQAAKRNAANPLTAAVAIALISGANNLLDPKPR